MRQLRWTSIKWSVLRGICAVIVPGKSRRLSQLSVRVGIWLNYQKRFNEPSETVGGGWQENLGDWKIKSTISGEKRSRISNSTLNFFLEISSCPVLWTWWEQNNTVQFGLLHEWWFQGPTSTELDLTRDTLAGYTRNLCDQIMIFCDQIICWLTMKLFQVNCTQTGTVN